MGAAVANRAIHDAVVADVEAPGIEFFHGYTYSGHPLAAAAAIAALDVYADNALFSRAAELAPAWEEALHCLAEAPGVRDIRTIGLVRSEEHKSELQSLMRTSYAFFCLDKTKINNITRHTHHQNDT